nr:reverse transcriptase domain-containing protein [Tanacetum cinerariifolium]
MLHFLRLAGFLGAAASIEEEQAKNFQWGLRRPTLSHLMCMSYTDVAQVTNAARNYEILHERDDDDTERPDKRQKSGDRHQPTSQQSSHRNYGHNNDHHGSDRRGGSDNHRSNNNNYSGGIGGPFNTIADPKSDLKAITTRSGVSYNGPPIPPPFSFLPKVVERVSEVTKDTVQPSTENIQPLIVQTQVPIDAPVVAPKPKPTIPYPSRVTKQKLREKDDNLALKFVEIFRKLHFDLSFADALLHMPKFALMLKSLLNNKEKLFNLATNLMNENFSAVILKKLSEKLGDPDKFLISCDFSELDECLALVDLGASINLVPLSIWRKFSLPELTPTRMILELADRSTTRPASIAKDVFVKVGKFHFPTDFVVVDYVVNPRIPLILGRPFLRTERALIDVYGEELTLRVDDETITFKVGQTSKYSYNDVESINRINVIDVDCEEYVQEVLGFFDNYKSGNPTLISNPIITLSSPSLTPFEGGDFILEEIEACLTSKLIPPRIDDTDFDLEGDIRLQEELLNNDPSSFPLPLKELNVEEIKTVKSSIDEPPELELKDLPSHLEYAFLEGTDKSPDDFKPVVQHRRRVNPKIHEVIKKKVIKLLDAGLIYPISDSPWVSPIHCVPKKGGMIVVENEDKELIPTRCMMVIFHDMIEKTMEVFMDNFSEKCHFMVKEGIVLGHKISKSGIEVDRAKVDVIAKLPHPTSVKGVRSFLGHAGFYHRFIQDFSKIARPMTHLLEKETPFIFSKECIESFNTLKKKLTEAPILVAPDWDLPFEIMCDVGDYAVGAVLGQPVTDIIKRTKSKQNRAQNGKREKVKSQPSQSQRRRRIVKWTNSYPSNGPGGFTVVENKENEIIPTRLVMGWRVCINYRKLNDATRKDHIPLPSMDQMLERLAGNEYYCFLDGFRCMMAIFHDMIEKTMGVFMDDFSVFGNSFRTYLSYLDKMLKRCEDTNLCLNWKKIHFMVKEGIILGHKISKNGIEVDKAKVEVITKLPHPTTVKGIRSFLGHAGFYPRFIQDFSKIARPMTCLLDKDTLFFFSKECTKAFQTLKKKLFEAPILVAPDWDLPFELMCDASDFSIGAVLGQR